MSAGLAGGCACGAVRYRLASAPYDAGWCHCETCRRWSGAPAIAFATVPLSDFHVEAGAESLGRFETKLGGERTFCARCGSTLTMHVPHQPDEIDVALGSLDQPDRVSPGFHIFFADKVAWFDPGDDLPRHAKLRPDTRGLPEGKTEL